MEEECFQELKKKIASSNCLGVPRPKRAMILITDASDVGGGGEIYQWQQLNPAELTHCHYRTTGLNRDGSLKHDYPSNRVLTCTTGTLELEMEPGPFQLQHLRPGAPGRYVAALIPVPTIGI